MRMPATLLFVFCGLACATSASQAAAAEPLEDKVKAAFLFNFARFTTWPQERFSGPDAPLEICVQADRGFVEAVSQSVVGKALGTRPLAVRGLAAGSDAAGCHVLYVGDAANVAAALADAAGRGILTVHGDDSALRDGVVRFFVEDRRIRFEINAAAAARENLQLSSKLMSLASVVSK